MVLYFQDVDKCIAVLDELIKLEVNSSLLPNNSGIVETIRKVGVGVDLTAWRKSFFQSLSK